MRPLHYSVDKLERRRRKRVGEGVRFVVPYTGAFLDRPRSRPSVGGLVSQTGALSQYSHKAGVRERRACRRE